MEQSNVIYESASVQMAPDKTLPERKRFPKGWSAIPIGSTGSELKLKWSGLKLQKYVHNPNEDARLRITIAVAMHEELRVEAYLLVSGQQLGVFDIRYAYLYQPFELPLSIMQVQAALEEGIGLRIMGADGDAALWIFDDLAGDEARRFFTPHLMVAGKERRMEQFLDRMMSLDSLQPFGWIEGCVLDGLYELRQIAGADKADQVITSHLHQYMDSEGKLTYEDLRGAPADDRFSGMESTLPIAVIAKREHDHPLMDKLIQYWGIFLNDETGTLSAGSAALTAEGAYTMCYPMAVIATRRQDERLARTAIRQLLIRRDILTSDSDLYGIVKVGNEKTMRNWARSCTWYMLGLIRTWLELHHSRQYAELPGMRELSDEFKRISAVVLSKRETEGLWSCFLGESETGIETSGSAGIAAALALGARHDLLPQASFDAAKNALHALEHYLTPDGILHGVCQHNCGGLQLQRGGYRVLSQMGMGLMSQLYVAVYARP